MIIDILSKLLYYELFFSFGYAQFVYLNLLHHEFLNLEVGRSYEQNQSIFLDLIQFSDSKNRVFDWGDA